MDIEIYSLLATSILLISLATIVFSIYSYILFRVREGRKLKKTGGHGHGAAAPEPEPTPEPATPEPKAEEIASFAAAVGQSAPPVPAEPAEPAKPRTQGRFFKPYNPGS